MLMLVRSSGEGSGEREVTILWFKNWGPTTEKEALGVSEFGEGGEWKLSICLYRQSLRDGYMCQAISKSQSTVKTCRYLGCITMSELFSIMLLSTNAGGSTYTSSEPMR